MQVRLTPRRSLAVIVMVTLLATLVPVDAGTTSEAAPAALSRLALSSEQAGELTFAPNPATVGQLVTASGCGFTPSITTATVSVNGTPASATSVAPSGATGCYSVACVMPTLAAGVTSASVIIVIGSVTGTGALSVGSTSGTGTLTLTPSQATAGQMVTASGCGFTPSLTSATILVNGTPASATSVTPTGSTGCYSVAFVMPALAAGNSIATVTVTIGSITGSGTISTGATAGIASLAASPSSVAAGTSVTLSGSGFTAGTQVTVSAFGTSQTVTAPAGSFSAVVAVPAGTTPGTYTITAMDTLSVSAVASVTVTTSTGSLQSNLSSAQPGQTIAVTATGFMPSEPVTVSLANPASTTLTAISGTTQTYSADTTGAISNVQYTVPSVTAGTYLLLAVGQTSQTTRNAAFTVLASVATATATATPPPATATPSPSPTTPPSSPTATATLTLPPLSTASTTTYFAEGYTGSAAVDGKVTFTERLYFYNPASATSTVTTTYAVYDPATKADKSVTKQNTVASGATVSRLVNQDVGNDRMASATVSASSGIVADEVISRTRSDGTALDGGSSLGSPTLATTWYLAEGYAGQTMQEYLVLYNPGTTAAKAQVQYLPSDTKAPAPVPVTIPAASQVTINVGSQYDSLALTGSKDIATEITSDAPIAADRVMYWGDGGGSAKYGFSMAPAIATGSQTESFPLLPTSGGSQPFLTVLNSSSGTANVSLKLLDATGKTLKTIPEAVKPLTRYTFDVAGILPGDHGNLSGVLTSDTPVIAEASLYFGGSPNAGSNPGIVEQGIAGMQSGAGIFLASSAGLMRIYNPGTTDAQVQVTQAGSTGSASIFNGTVASGDTTEVQLPAADSAAGTVVLANGSIAAAMINGGAGSTSITGGSLN